MTKHTLHNSVRTLADALGIGKTLAYKLLRAGAPGPVDDAGRYSEEQWRAWAKANKVALGLAISKAPQASTAPVRSIAPARPASSPRDDEGEDEDLDLGDDDDPEGPLPNDPAGSSIAFRNSRTRLVRLQRQRLKGKLVPREYVERLAEAIALTCLSVLLEAPAALAQQYPELDPKVFRDRAQGVLDAGRRRVATDLPKILFATIGDPPGGYGVDQSTKRPEPDELAADVDPEEPDRA
jgi:hypothetical protein